METRDFIYLLVIVFFGATCMHLKYQIDDAAKDASRLREWAADDALESVLLQRRVETLEEKCLKE